MSANYVGLHTTVTGMALACGETVWQIIPPTLYESSEMASEYGRFVWHDLMTTDTDSAKKFYGEVAGWGTQPWEGSPYIFLMNEGDMIGGMMPISEEMRKNKIMPSWTPSVGVENVDATAAKAAELGGKIVAPPMDIPDIGRYAIIQDPQGMSLAIFKSNGEMPGHEGAPREGEFSWHELLTTDYVAAFKFYSTLFGWEKMLEHDMGPMGIYLIYGLRGQQYGGMLNKSPEMPAGLGWLCYVKVANAKAAAEIVTRLGGQVMGGPMEVPGGDWITICEDPQGAKFAVHASKS